MYQKTSRKLVRGPIALDRPRRLLLELLEHRLLLSSAPWTLPNLSKFDPASYSADSLLVSFKPGADLRETLPGMRIGQTIGLDTQFREVQLHGLSVSAALQALSNRADVDLAEPNWILTRQANDPFYVSGSLWGMQGDEVTVGVGATTNQYGSQANEVWASAVANPVGSRAVYIGIIDEGIDYIHPDLAANIWTNPFDLLGDTNGDGNNDDDFNGYADDIHGWDFANSDNSIYDGTAADLSIDAHGTHVAGTIGAVGNNNEGVAGVNWSVQMISGKFLNPGGGTTANAIRAIDYFTDLKRIHGLNIVALNNSWGGGGYSQAMQDAITRAAQKNILFIAAAGNGGGDGIGDDNDVVASYPSSYNSIAGAGYDNVISVAATDSAGNLGSFSNFGAGSVDLGAPGVGVLSTTPGNNYNTYSGTSMATPHVTGAVALYAANHGAATANDIRYKILDGANSTPSTALASKTVTGGRLNIAATFNMDPDLVGPRITQSNPSGDVLGPISTVRLNFSEAVGNNPNTQDISFTTADIKNFKYTDSAGVITDLTVQTVTTVAGSDNRQFDVSLASQSSSGVYSLEIGPEIRDRAGNLMDQNRNGAGGEVTSDIYIVTFKIGNQINASSVPVALGGMWSIASSQITISQDVTITDLDVQVNINHTNVGDLIVHLHDPSGKQVILSNRRGGTGDHFLDTRFDDEAGLAISSGSAPFSGTYKPDQFLSQYDGKNLRGTWTLYVENWGSVGGGQLNAWSMIVNSEGPNNPPVAANDAYSLQDASLVVAAPGVLANDTDANSDAITAVLVEGPLYGSLTLNANGSFTFTPGTTYSDNDSFTYAASDGKLQSNPATVLISGTVPVNSGSKFFVVNDGSPDRTFEYTANGSTIENYTLNSGNTAPRGAASNKVGDKVWVVDKNRKVYVYDPSGTLLAFWTAGTMNASATPEGIATNGTDVWIVDSASDKVFKYAGAANLVSGSFGTQTAVNSGVKLASGNTNPKDIVTDGNSLWVVNDSSIDSVFKYTLDVQLLGSWSIKTTKSVPASPTGITLDPSNPAHLWIVDSGTDRVYQYDNAVGRVSDSQAASTSFPLAAGNTNPQGIADPPVSTSTASVAVVNPGAADVYFGYAGAVIFQAGKNTAPLSNTGDRPLAPEHTPYKVGVELASLRSHDRNLPEIPREFHSFSASRLPVNIKWPSLRSGLLVVSSMAGDIEK